MRYITLFLALTFAASAQTVRDSAYTVDSTASALVITVQLTAKQSAALYRIFGATWQDECRSSLVSLARTRDPYSEFKDQYDAIMTSSLTTAQKRVALDALGIPDPRIVKVTRLVAVPKLAP